MKRPSVTNYPWLFFKPSLIKDFLWEEDDRNWNKDKLSKVSQTLNQKHLFQEEYKDDFQLVRKLPYQFFYRFEDDSGREARLMIEDWEIGSLFWNCLKKHGEQAAVQKVREKSFDDFLKKRDVYFFLGTTLRWHRSAQNPFLIVGVFYPPKIRQKDLSFSE